MTVSGPGKRASTHTGACTSRGALYTAAEQHGDRAFKSEDQARLHGGRDRAGLLWGKSWIVIVLLTLALVGEGVRVWGITNHHDLQVFMLAAQRLVAGEDIYADAAPFKAAIEAGTFSMKDNTVVWPYAYAPLIALIFVPALRLPLAVVQGGWWLLNAGSLVVGIWLVLKAMLPADGMAPGRMRYLLSGAILSLVLLYRFDPAVVALRLGQIEIAQFLLLTITLYALRQRRDGIAGVALGVAAGLKFFPLALVALLLWRRRWRAATWAIAVALAMIVGSFSVVGLQAVPAYIEYASIYGIGGAFAAFPLNQSLNGLFSRNLMHNVFSPSLGGVDLPWLARGLTLASSALVVLLSAWLTWHPAGTGETEDEDGRRLGLEFSLAVMALLLISPHSQVYTFVWSLLSLVALGAWLLAESGSRWWEWVGLGIAYLLLGRSYVVYYSGITRFVQSHYMFGALCLWALVGVILLQRRRGAGRAGSVGA